MELHHNGVVLQALEVSQSCLALLHCDMRNWQTYIMCEILCNYQRNQLLLEYKPT